jgi:hypothetical protein
MRVRSGWMVGVMGLLLLASSAPAQSGTEAGVKKEVIANGGLLHSLMAAPVVGQPYSAVQQHSTRQQLADGTTIHHEGHHVVARDAEGRVRVELRMAAAHDGEPETVMVFVTDPVAHTLTTWVSGGKEIQKVATVVKLPSAEEQAAREAKRAAAAQAAAATAEANRPQPTVTTEDLGTDSLNGVPVTVSRTTTIVPAGRSGNDAPITKTHETWTSPDLKLVMKEQWTDPRTGERTVELVNFTRADPDSALFRAPRGYTVKSVMESLKDLEEKLSAGQN